MKFVNPELEVTMFSVEDILTTSGAGPDPTETDAPISAVGTGMEGDCVGTKADNFVPNCL